MKQLNAWIVLVIGILLLLKEQTMVDLSALTNWNGWLIAIGVIVIGIVKLMKK